MTETKAVWKSQVLAERVRCLAHSVAMEAAARDSKAYAVVASEALKLAEEILGLAERARFGEMGDASFLEALSGAADRLELLSLNAGFVAFESRGDKAIAISADELRAVALELRRLAPRRCSASDLSSGDASIEPASPSRATKTADWFLSFFVGAEGEALRIVENLSFVRELMLYDKLALKIEGASMDLRGRCIPFIDLAAVLGVARPERDEDRRVLVVNTDWQEEPALRVDTRREDTRRVSSRRVSSRREYGLAIDGVAVDAIFRSRVGRPVPARGRAASWAREAWDASDGSQYLFLDCPAISGH
jgi:Chemotaxis signal transduction protein